MRAICLLLFMMLGFAGTASAQDEEMAGGSVGGICFRLRGCAINLGSYHKLQDEDDEIQKLAGGEHGCLWCVNQDHKEIGWDNCHPIGCEDQSPNLAAIVQAAKQRNIDEVLRLAPTATKHVGLNFARQSIQIKSCSGSLIANLPLTDLNAALEKLGRSTVVAWLTTPIGVWTQNNDAIGLLGTLQW